MTAAERAASDRALFDRLLRLPQVEWAQRLLLFCGMGTEPETGLLLDALTARGKELCLPRCLPGHELELRRYCGPAQLVRHRYGMLEPSGDCPLVEDGWPEIALIPAVCYDRQGGRLGRGGGFYDRFLARYRGLTIGLCREALLQEAVPREAHDRAVCLVVTERGVFRPDHSIHI